MDKRLRFWHRVCMTPKQKPRRPNPDEAQILAELLVRPIEPDETARYDELISAHHYLKSSGVVGRHVRYVAEYRGQWLALATWSAAARHVKARDETIGWDDEQRRRRLALVANNSRLLVLPECQCPNLISRFMKLMLQRLSEDWRTRWGDPLLLAETFVDPVLFQGTAYKASAWIKVGETSGYRRDARDYYIKHDRPKDLWLRELRPGAMEALRGETLPADCRAAEERVAPRCTAPPDEIRSIREIFEGLADPRSGKSKAYPLSGLLTIVLLATLCGVSRGQRDLAAFAKTMTQAQLRQLGFRRDKKTREVRAPGETTFFRILHLVDEREIETALLRWQEHILGPPADEVVAIDGKKLRHSGGVELVSAFGVETGRWMGTERTDSKSNEIPAARILASRLDLTGKIVVADALHTQVETADLLLREKGAEYCFTVKANQKEMLRSCESLLTERAFSPSAC